MRLAELVVALSLATDLGLGQPLEHVLRSTAIALRIGERTGLEPERRSALFHVGMLSFVGCTVDGGELADLFGDDIAFRAATYDVDTAGIPMLGFLLRQAAAGGPPAQRARALAALVATGPGRIQRAMLAHCQATGGLAERFGLGGEVRRALQHAFARWDGKGLPPEASRDAIEPLARIVHIAEITEVAHRSGGTEAVAEVARERSGRQFDPDLAAELAKAGDELFAGLDELDWPALIESEPGLRDRLPADRLDDALEAIADFCDLRSLQFAGHSRSVADLASAAALTSGLGEGESATVRRAALLQDLGRAGVSATIWDKPGPLSPGEWERVRLHTYFTERMLARPPVLAAIGELAAAHHERMDGSGYHRGLAGSAVPAAARLLAAADVHRAVQERRAHRPPAAAADADRLLRSEAKAGRLDADAVDAVLAAAAGRGHASRRRGSGPAGLTPREVEVLRMLATGVRNRDVAEALHISRKTVATHVEHIYAKAGVSTRAGAALFAMRHGLVDAEKIG
ncbi:MAG TPA: HD domain-containing phosphohydrolase [Thermoleophilaceae bacterium]|nr:HD domain-containing phosphohydrolase [Thermoleophilaceae bacterium]